VTATDPDRRAGTGATTPSAATAAERDGRWTLDSDRVPPWFRKALFLTLVSIAGLVIARQVVIAVSDLLVTVLAALFLSFAAEPAVDYLADRGWRRGTATALVFVVILVVGGLFTWLLIDLVVKQVRGLANDAPNLIGNATDWINRRFNTKITTAGITDQLKKYQGDIGSTAADVGGRVVSITGTAVGAIFQVFTVSLFAFYFVADGPKFRRTICSFLAPRRQRMVLDLWELAINKTGGYLYSRLLLAILNAMASWIAFSIIGVPSPLALAMFSGVVSQFVPVIGTYIGGALPTLVALLDSPPKALWMLGFYVIYQQIENYLFAPKITSRTMDIHPAVAFGSALAGAEILGGVGALLALPAAAILQAFVSSFLERHEVVESDLISDLVDEAAGPEAASGLSPPADPGSTAPAHSPEE